MLVPPSGVHYTSCCGKTILLQKLSTDFWLRLNANGYTQVDRPFWCGCLSRIRHDKRRVDTGSSLCLEPTTPTNSRIVRVWRLRPTTIRLGKTSRRIVAQASWESLLDQSTNLNLKIGILDRYDSAPQGLAKRLRLLHHAAGCEPFSPGILNSAKADSKESKKQERGWLRNNSRCDSVTLQQ